MQCRSGPRSPRGCFSWCASSAHMRAAARRKARLPRRPHPPSRHSKRCGTWTRAACAARDCRLHRPRQDPSGLAVPLQRRARRLGQFRALPEHESLFHAGKRGHGAHDRDPRPLLRLGAAGLRRVAGHASADHLRDDAGVRRRSSSCLPGQVVAAGDVLGTHIGNQTFSDVAVGVWAGYAARGAASRQTFILTREQGTPTL
jgi:hypothetical protein